WWSPIPSGRSRSIPAWRSSISRSSIRSRCGRPAWRRELTSEVMVRVEGLRKSYGAVEAVRGVSVQGNRRPVGVLIGPSGCGQSTLVRCIIRLETPSAGTLQVGERAIDFGAPRSMPHGRDLARFRARIGMVFQQFDLFPHMTALRNVMSGPVIVKKLRQADAETIAR